jgi:hypothetical protein
MLGFVCRFTFYSYTIYSLLWFCFTVVRSKLECVSPVWNSITSTDANKLRCIQRKFAALCLTCSFPHIPYYYAFASELLKFYTLQVRRLHFDAVSCSCSFQDLNFVLLWFIILVLEVLLVLETSPSFLQHALPALPLDTLQLQIWYVVTYIYLEGQLDFWNRSHPSSTFHLVTFYISI